MMRFVSLLSVVGVSMQAATAWAGSLQSCGGPQLEIEGQLSASWARSVDQSLARLRGAPDFDPCARLVITAEDEEIVIHVNLADGRTALRRVQRPEDLLETVTAVLVLPSEGAPAGRATEPISSSSRSPVPPTATAELTRDAKPAALSAHVDLGAGVDGRISGAPGYACAGVSAFANVLIDPWLLGVFARWDAMDIPISRATPSGFDMHTWGLGVQVGLRESIAGLTLDWMAGPEMVVETQEADGPNDSIGGDMSDVRLEFGLRLSGAKRARVGFYVGADVDVSPARMLRSKQFDVNLPPLPSWSSGATLGLKWNGL